MKIFFGINITNNKKNTQIDGDAFLYRKSDEEQVKAIDAESEKLSVLYDKMVPKPLRVLYTIFLVATVVCCVLITKTWENSTHFSEVYAKFPWLFYVGGGCLVLWAIVAGSIRKHTKETAKSDETAIVINRYNAVMENALRALGAPPDCPQIETFLVYYKNKNGKIKLLKQGNALFLHSEYCIYADENALYFAVARQNYAIPRDEITRIRKIKKRTNMLGWIKDTPHNKGEYKTYKITRSNGDIYHLRYYYSLDILHNGETYELYFPPYELSVLTELTGLTPYQK